MAIKIPQDIIDIIDTSAGKEPVAFIDIFEEKGDFDVIDTQNQFKSIGSPELVNDVNVDFNRKPGFAVLAPGKHVSSQSTAIIYGWGSNNIDYSLFPELVAGFTLRKNMGFTQASNGEFFGILKLDPFSISDFVGSNYLIHSKDGVLFKAIVHLTTKGNDIESFSNYDGMVVAPIDGNEDITIISNNGALSVVSTAQTVVAAGTANYFIQCGIVAGGKIVIAGQGPAGGLISVYSASSHAHLFTVSVSAFTHANSIVSITYNPIDGMYYMIGSTAFGGTTLLKSSLSLSSSPINVAYNFTSIQHYIRTMSNNLMVTLNTQTSSVLTFDVASITAPSSPIYPAQFKAGIYHSTNDGSGSLSVKRNSASVHDVIQSSDGVNFNISTTAQTILSGIGIPQNSLLSDSRPLITNFVTFFAGSVIVASSKGTINIGPVPDGIQNYTVKVKDEYFIDSGKGKK